jgi:Tfp pilus assembly protein PilX
MEYTDYFPGAGMTNNQGFVLATLLILLAALSLLAIHTLNSSLLQNKMSHNFFIGAQRLYDAEHILKLAETAIEQQNNLRCYLKSQLANYVLTIKNTQGLPILPSCRVNLTENRIGYYVVQTIQTSSDTEYYRLTGWMEEGILVQSTYVRLQGHPRLTRLSWRLLS